jgi:lipoyl(octanoyl) transferase
VGCSFSDRGRRLNEEATVVPIRLIVDPPASGAWNMSVDEALMHSVANGVCPDTLRFYQWSEPTLSLGYFQKLEDRGRHSASVLCPVVRRSSGGGAILHDRELTYSIAMCVSDRFAARELYDAVHEALLAFLAYHSLQAELYSLSPVGLPEPSFLCFQRRTKGDVVFHGEKICGSAQRRVGPAVLQHGSLLIERSRLAPELPGILELSGRSLPDSAILVEEWKSEIERRLGRPIRPGGGWSGEEIREAERWERERFGDLGWISRR